MENIKDKKNDDILEKLVHINRITKVVKGGRRFGFSALVVVGNQNGKIGIAHAKAKQVPDAIKKANELARRKLIQIPLRDGRTIHHDIYGKDGAGKIKLRSAPKGTGINMVKKHVKTTKEKKGGIVSKENFIHLSNLAIFDTKNKNEAKK